jgi:hypothetical protein
VRARPSLQVIGGEVSSYQHHKHSRQDQNKFSGIRHLPYAPCRYLNLKDIFITHSADGSFSFLDENWLQDQFYQGGYHV